MKAFMITANVKEDKISETQQAVGQLFAAIKEANIQGVSYTVSKAVDSPAFTIFLAFEGEENPLANIPAFSEFQVNLRSYIAGPPAQQSMQIIGSYNAL